MAPFPAIHHTTRFTHQTWDRIAQIVAFSTTGPCDVGGERGVELRTIVLAPARAASVTGDQLTLVMRIFPRNIDGPCPILSKGLDQYQVFLPDAEHLSFTVTTNTTHTLTVPLPGGWSDKWHDVAAVYTGNALQLYIDGRLLDEVNASGLICYAPGGLVLGGASGRSNVTPGLIASIQVYDAALVSDALTGVEDGDCHGARLDLRFDTMTTFDAPPAESSNRPADSGPAASLLESLERWEPSDGELRSGNLTGFAPVESHNSDYTARWTLQSDGHILGQGECSLERRAENVVGVSCDDYTMPAPEPGTEYWLIVEFAGADGSPSGRTQFLLPDHSPPQPGPPLSALPNIDIREEENTGYFTGEDFSIEIDLPTATITSWVVDGEELLELGPIHQLWRAPLLQELDGASAGGSIATAWSAAGLAENIMGITAMEALQNTPQRVTLRFQGLIIRRNSDVLFEIERDYAIHGDGEVVLTQRLKPVAPLPPCGRIGLELRLPPDMKNVQWFGAGPSPLFEDSRPGSIIDRYENTLETDFPRDPWPREQGHKSAVRWMTLRNDAGRGLFLGSDKPFTATTSPYTAFQLSEALHPNTLTPDSAYTVHVDQVLRYGEQLNTNTLPSEALTVSLRMRGLLPENDAPWDILKTGIPIDVQTS